MAEIHKRNADVIVIGGGGAGLMAALEAARQGSTVILLEKNLALGGTTARSVGSISLSGSPFQTRQGITDTPEQHFDDMALFAGELIAKDNPALRRLLTNHIPETFADLMALGIEFFGPMPEPPHRYPRMHNVLPHARAYIHHLSRHARKQGVMIALDTEATRLLREGERVTGVAVSRRDSGPHHFLARKGVIVAAGDYSANATMKAEYVAPELAAIEGINPTATGDGQRMLREVGAEIVNGDVMLGPEIRFVAPPRKPMIEAIPPIKPVAKFVKWSMRAMPDRLLRPFLMMFVTTNLGPSARLFEEGAILVNRAGERFTDERHRPVLAIARQPDKIAYILFDDRVARMFSAWPRFISTAPGVAYAYLEDYRRNRKDIYRRATTLGALARALDMSPATLAAHASTLAEPPYYALGPVKSWIVATDGGARVTLRLEVVDASGKPIPGLYAAGSSGQGGLLLEGHGHHLAWAFVSGQIAGRSAAQS